VPENVNPKTNEENAWYDLEGYDNPGNDRIAIGSPDAGGTNVFGYDAILGGGGGLTYSYLETPAGNAHYLTTRQSVGLSFGFNAGVTAGFYTCNSKNRQEQAASIEGNGAVINLFIFSVSGDLTKDKNTGKTAFGKNWIFVGLNANLGIDYGITQTVKVN